MRALVNREKRESPREGIVPENYRVKCFKCKELGHYSRECPRTKTPEELLFHKKRVDAKNVTVEEDSSREPDKVTTELGKTDSTNLDNQDQKRWDPSVREVPQILLQADDTKRSSKNNRCCVSVQAHVDDRNELNLSRAWRTSQRAQDDHDKQFLQANNDDVENVGAGYKEEPRVSSGRRKCRQVKDDDGENVDGDEGPNLSSERQAFRQAEDDDGENVDDEGPNLSPGRQDDHDENVNVDDEKEPDILLCWQTFWQADDDHGKEVGVDKKSDILLGWLTSQPAGEGVRESGDSDEDTVFEMKMSQIIAKDADEDSTTCQPATYERAGSVEGVDDGDHLRGPFLIQYFCHKVTHHPELNLNIIITLVKITVHTPYKRDKYENNHINTCRPAAI
ncbi:uncharacterized protein LOC121834525 [Ixodes scapularis]|uniref:uncharacterized protein LOC121834525 n=1 Tax=Ixodes scapularis TaxID=6945 RepID=UPI001C38898B|nr:uncharacterized protein LOC121834525 [Ixodes scapularis]